MNKLASIAKRISTDGVVSPVMRHGDSFLDIGYPAFTELHSDDHVAQRYMLFELRDGNFDRVPRHVDAVWTDADASAL